MTFHGPGQLVGYPILDLRGYRQDLHWYLRTLEDALIAALVSAARGEEERRARGRRAQTDSRRYGWAEIARRFASLYEELLSSPRQRVARGRRA